jgi:5-methylthioadenosine/S-adenosylhomocysteine deaminase
MKTGSLLQKVATGDPTVLPAKTCVRMATIEGAKILGVHDEVGSIEEDKLADIILVDFSEPHLNPWYPKCPDNIFSHLVYCAKGGDVSTVIVNGRIIMDDRKVLSLDQKRVIEDSQDAANEILRDAGLNHFFGD